MMCAAYFGIISKQHFLKDRKCQLEWLAKSEIKLLEQVEIYINKRGNTKYGIIFIEEC